MKYSQFFRKCQTKVKKILTSICICSVLLTGCNAEAEAETEVKEIIEYNGSCADSCEYEHVVAIDFVSQENWTEGRFFSHWTHLYRCVSTMNLRTGQSK